MSDPFGTLRLQAAEAPAGPPAWSDIPLNGILTVAAAVLLLLFLSEIIRLMPLLLECVTRVRPNLSLEHSLHQARSRNTIAILALLPFCLMADRYTLYSPRFLEALNPGWRVPALIGVLVAWLLLRKLVELLVFAARPPRLDAEERSALHRNLFNCFVVLVALQFCSLCIARFLCSAPDSVIRLILLVETAVMFGVSLGRSGQILRAKVGGFSTFLYLCALEWIPAAALVASAVVL